MDFNDNPKEAEFRSQVREFLDQNAQKRSDVSLTGSSAGAPETVSGEDAAKEALKNKLHVIIEKPMTTSSKHAKKLTSCISTSTIGYPNLLAHHLDIESASVVK